MCNLSMRVLGFIWLACLFMTGSAIAAPVVLVVGDSLSAGYGLERLESSWVSLLQEQLRAENYPHQVVNASISGDTTAGARARLGPALQRYRPQVVILELGGNDGLRGLSPAAMADNLRAMISAARAADAQVLLLGVRLPPNYGRAYTRAFESVYRHLAAELEVALVPQLLAGVAEDRRLMQSDGIHPTEEAQPRLLANVLPMLKPLLEAGQPAASAGG